MFKFVIDSINFPMSLWGKAHFTFTSLLPNHVNKVPSCCKMKFETLFMSYICFSSMKPLNFQICIFTCYFVIYGSLKRYIYDLWPFWINQREFEKDFDMFGTVASGICFGTHLIWIVGIWICMLWNLPKWRVRLFGPFPSFLSITPLCKLPSCWYMLNCNFCLELKSVNNYYQLWCHSLLFNNPLSFRLSHGYVTY